MKYTISKPILLASAVAFGSFAGTNVQAAEPASCKNVGFSDVGWTDITATTAAHRLCSKRLAIRQKLRFFPCL